jgi:hypothetical protein
MRTYSLPRTFHERSEQQFCVVASVVGDCKDHQHGDCVVHGDFGVFAAHGRYVTRVVINEEEEEEKEDARREEGVRLLVAGWVGGWVGGLGGLVVHRVNVCVCVTQNECIGAFVHWMLLVVLINGDGDGGDGGEWCVCEYVLRMIQRVDGQ